MIVVLMGVSGCGKTTIGRELAQKMGGVFYEGDDCHPQGNIDKMSKGIPLIDQDRWQWLDTIRTDIIVENLNTQQVIVIACSALKEAYRKRLKQNDGNVVFVFLRGDFQLIWNRVHERQDHFMKESMLQSQFNALEPPTDAVEINIDTDVNTITDTIIKAMSERT